MLVKTTTSNLFSQGPGPPSLVPLDPRTAAVWLLRIKRIAGLGASGNTTYPYPTGYRTQRMVYPLARYDSGGRRAHRSLDFRTSESGSKLLGRLPVLTSAMNRKVSRNVGDLIKACTRMIKRTPRIP
jgi:hypothetical protein